MTTETLEREATPEIKTISFDDLALVPIFTEGMDEWSSNDLTELKSGLGAERFNRIQSIVKQDWTGEDLGNAYAQYLEKVSLEKIQKTEGVESNHLGFEAERGVNFLLKKTLGIDAGSQILTPEYMNERKQFVESIVKHAATMPRGEISSAFAQRFNVEFCSSSPNVLDYVGGPVDSIELAGTITTVPEFAEIYSNSIGSIVYDLSFSHDQEAVGIQLADSIAAAATDQQLRMFRVLRAINGYASNDHYDGMSNAINIVRIAAEHTESKKLNGIADRIAIATLNESKGLLEGRDLILESDDMDEEGNKLLHYELTALRPIIKFNDEFDTSHSPSRIARNLIGSRDRWGVITGAIEINDEVVDRLLPTESDAVLLYIAQFLDRPNEYIDAESVVRSYLQAHYKNSEKLPTILDDLHSLRTYVERREFIDTMLSCMDNPSEPLELSPEPLADYLKSLGVDVSDEQMRIFQELHRPEIRAYLEWQFGGIRFEKFDIESQIRLFEFAANTNQAEFNRLLEVTSYLPEKAKVYFLESFTALEYGSDFGEVLLDIAENAETAELTELLETINNFKDTSQAFAKLFPKNVRQNIEKGMNERLTEILFVAREVAINGHAEGTMLNDLNIKVDSLGELIEDTRLLEKSIFRIVDVLQNGSVNRVVTESDNFNLYRFTADDDQILAYIRPEEAARFDPEIEYGRPGRGVEASISFIVAPEDTEYLSPYKKERANNELSIRLDLENNNSRTKISLDIGAILGAGESFGTRIGRIIALGNLLRSEQLGTKVSLNHNSNAFDQEEFGTPEGFRRLANQMDQMAKSHLPGNSSQPSLKAVA